MDNSRLRGKTHQKEKVMLDRREQNKSEHVTSLTREEWIGILVLLFTLGGFISYSAMYQGFKIGQFDSGGMVAMVVAFPLVRYIICRLSPMRTVHIVNHLQTAIGAAGASVGMGSMLLAYEWTAGRPLSGFEVAAIALPSSIFGILAANLFAKKWINEQKFTFASGLAGGSMLNGLGQGGNTLHMLVVGLTIAIPLFVWKSPLTALAVGSGWIIGWEVMGWALLTALVCKHFEPALKDLNLIKESFREVTIYFGACVIITAGVVDMFFIYFGKNTEDNPHFSKREGFMKMGQNLLALAGVAVVTAISMQFIFGLPWYTTMGVYGLLVILVYIGGTCTGKTNVGPVSALSGGIILFITMLKYSGAQALTYGAGAGQALSNSMDVGHDFRAGERVGSSLILQRRLQMIGAAVGGSVIIGGMYQLLMSAYGEKLTYAVVTSAEPEFNAGFALKYHAFLDLGSKLEGMVGTVCLWVVGVTLIVQVVTNLIKIAGYPKVARVIPSTYACSMAFFIPFGTTVEQGIGGAIGLAAFLVWSLFGKKVDDPTSDPEKLHKEPKMLGLNWSCMIGIPSGLVVGESLASFIDALLIVKGYKDVLVSQTAKVCVIALFFLVGTTALIYFKKKEKISKLG
ncbi:MAG: OPT/YSL family transporter [Candidatus Yonathbacteria bacterium]|nr:OPT/YSL family transporter [Candidatus Yonathbacteria bacterium]